MTDFPQTYYEYHLSQIATLSVPYGYDHKKVIPNQEILFIINCKDGIKIIYVDPDSIYISYEY